MTAISSFRWLQGILAKVSGGGSAARQFEVAGVWALNPQGSVPVLQEGDWALTRNAAIVGYLGERYRQANLFGCGDARSRAGARQWLAYVNSDLHKAFAPLFAPQRFTDDESRQAKLRAVAAGR